MKQFAFLFFLFIVCSASTMKDSALSLLLIEGCDISTVLNTLKYGCCFRFLISSVPGNISFDNITGSVILNRNRWFRDSVPGLVFNSNPTNTVSGIMSELNQVSTEELLFILALRLSVKFGGPEVLIEPRITLQPNTEPQTSESPSVEFFKPDEMISVFLNAETPAKFCSIKSKRVRVIVSTKSDQCLKWRRRTSN